MTESIKPVVVLFFITVVIAVNVSETTALTLPIIGTLPTVEVNRSISQSNKQSDDTLRIDPLDGFRIYKGGFDVNNKHYWSSTLFTGIYGYGIGVLWLLGGIVYLLKNRASAKKKDKLVKRRRERASCFNYYYCLCPTLFLTLLILVATALILGADAKFNSQARTVVSIIAKAAYDASESVYDVTGAIKNIVNLLGSSSSTMSDISGFLAYTSDQLDSIAADIQMQAKNSRGSIDKGLDIAYAVTTILIALNMIAAVALAVSGVLRLRRTVYRLIILCWFLTVLCWLFFGLYFSVNKFPRDTCVALENFQENPHNNSLNSLLPCDELFSAQSALSSVGAGIYVLVNTVNSNITEIQKTIYRNASYVCNPFSGPPEYKYQTGNCPSNTIRIGDIPQALRTFTCPDSRNGTCTDNNFMSPSDIRNMEAYSISLQTILNVYPDIEYLVGCQPVKNAFSEITLRHCEPLKRYTRMIWAGLVSLSLIMVLLVLLWIHQEKYQEELQYSLGVSVEQRFATAKVVGDNSSC